jgi:hypothetical protein
MFRLYRCRSSCSVTRDCEVCDSQTPGLLPFGIVIPVTELTLDQDSRQGLLDYRAEGRSLGTVLQGRLGVCDENFELLLAKCVSRGYVGLVADFGFLETMAKPVNDDFTSSCRPSYQVGAIDLLPVCLS